MGTEIAAKIAERKAKLPGLTRKQKVAAREELKRLTEAHAPEVIKTLATLVKDRKAPASSRVAAGSAILDRYAGKPLKEDEKPGEAQFDRLSESQLLSMICTTVAGLSQESRSMVAEALLFAQRGISLPDRFVDPDFSETEALKAEAAEHEGLPPLVREPKPKREPRR